MLDREEARRAHLSWVNDAKPGIERLRRGDGFRYRRPDGSPVRDAETLQRIRALAIPPAWTEVWICTDPIGHIQATGRDARSRKHYRYHPRWREMRDETKYDRTVEFAQALPRIRERVAADLRRHGLARERVLAAVVRLLDLTLVRVGNAEYAKSNQSCGLTTLRSRHVNVARHQRRRFFCQGFPDLGWNRDCCACVARAGHSRIENLREAPVARGGGGGGGATGEHRCGLPALLRASTGGDRAQRWPPAQAPVWERGWFTADGLSHE